MEQVLMNLAVNARDAMPNGGRLSIDTANIEVDAHYAASRPGLELGRYVRVRVSDTGVGMSRDVQARAFEPFFTTKPAGEGTGLGLATTYGIITQSGGRAQIYSEPGLGTTFTALLPAVDEPAETIDPVAEPPRAGGAETVLVVEDEDALLAVTERILTRNGYEALVASDGPSAIELAAAHDGGIDVVLTDIVMPRMLGTELADELIARHPQMRVIFMSGYARGVLGPIDRLPGSAVVIDKPFSETMLLDALREVLDGQRPPPVGEASPAGASELGHGRPAAP
jgi:CheY-like chemotaxis protein